MDHKNDCPAGNGGMHSLLFLGRRWHIRSRIMIPVAWATVLLLVIRNSVQAPRHLTDATSVTWNIVHQQQQPEHDTTPCPPRALYGSSQLPRPNMVIDCGALKGKSSHTDFPRLQRVLEFTQPKYSEYMAKAAGIEHYALLHTLTSQHGETTSSNHCGANHCRRPIVDIGTRYVASSLALGSGQEGVPIWTFDLPSSHERRLAFRGRSKKQWQQEVQSVAQVYITFHKVHLLNVSQADFDHYFSNTWLIVLDTAHLPDTQPFEREFLQRLLDMGTRTVTTTTTTREEDARRLGRPYQGLVVLDDIDMNPEMRRWWKELIQQGHDPQGRFHTHTLTSCGHATGTGLLDFSKSVQVRY